MEHHKQTVKHKATIRRPSIRFYLVLMNVVVLCLLFPVASLLYLHQDAKFRDIQLQRNLTQMHQALESRSGALVRNMALSADYAVAGYDFTFLNTMVRQVVREDKEIKYCLIMDGKALVVAHSDQEQVSRVLTGVKDRQVQAMFGSAFLSTIPEDHPPQVRFIEENTGSEEAGETVLEALAPIYSGAGLFAVLRCGYSLEQFTAEMSTVRREWADRALQFKIYLASITGLFFTIGVVIAALFTRAFVRSMEAVSTGVSRVAEGDLDHKIRPEGLVCAELVKLSEAFNAMTGQLQLSRRQLDEYNRGLEHTVATRTRELRDAQANLLQQAHEAGMAEMAVGILHNIGNAITPAKVGLYRLFSRMKQKNLLRDLPAALDEIAEMVPTLQALSDNEKNRLLNIIKLIPATIAEEYSQNVEEIEQIRYKLSHIESIIGLQMRYAQLFGDSEQVDVPQVIEDALTLLDESLKKRSIRVMKVFTPVPLIRIERTKLIQVIVNLIKNGYEAMDNAPIGDRTLILSIGYAPGSPGHLVFSVKDKGIGFTPEEKRNLFKFGYTTKTKGSGFGLHSCANYLIARNGSISAESDGPGKGAEFIVRLREDIPDDRHEKGDPNG